MKESKLFLHTKKNESELLNFYQKAISEAIELYIVSAYLTEWNINTQINLKLTPSKFKFIFGKDFGLSRKRAITNALEWLPEKFKNCLLVADRIQGFHPKAVFWKDKLNKYYALIGSSNLTNSAFNNNYEANVLCSISEEQFKGVLEWVKDIEKHSEKVTKEWINNYNQAIPLRIKPSDKYDKQIKKLLVYNKKLITNRREQLRKYESQKLTIKNLIYQCANNKLSNEEFYEELRKILKNGITFQPRFGWCRKGSKDNFKLLCQSLLKIYESNNSNRDEIVKNEIQRLNECKVSSRGSLLSELLCLEYPNNYPLLNKPVRNFFNNIGYKLPSDDGERYIEVARDLRSILSDLDKINNLAELDIIIQDKYR